MEQLQETVVISLERYTKLVEEKTRLETMLKSIKTKAYEFVEEDKVTTWKIERLTKDEAFEILNDETKITNYISNYGYDSISNNYFNVVTSKDLKDYAKASALKLVKYRLQELEDEENE